MSLEHVYIGFGIIDLISGKKTPGEITLSDGKIHLYSDSTGNRNWDILKPGTGGQKKIDLRRVNLKRVDAVFEDISKLKFYELWFTKIKGPISSTNEQIRFATNNECIIRNASFNTKMGSYLTNKKMTARLNFVYDKQSKTISLLDQVVRISGRAFKISAHFFFGKQPTFDMSIVTKNLPLKEAASIFPPKTSNHINKFELSKPLLNVRAFLSGPMKYLSFPAVKVYFSVEDASLGVSQVQFDHCSFQGFFKNVTDSSRPPDDRNSVFVFSDVKAKWDKNSI